MSIYPRNPLRDYTNAQMRDYLNWQTNPPSDEEVRRAIVQMIARDGIIDLVEVDGVWITPEDAAAR